MTPRICPVCGESVPPNSRACPECGACDETGWTLDRYEPQPDLPDDSFDYDAFIAKEFDSGPDRSSARRRPTWVIITVGLLLLGILVVGIMGGFRF